VTEDFGKSLIALVPSFDGISKLVIFVIGSKLLLLVVDASKGEVQINITGARECTKVV
jgi:hypothetical protein